MILFIDVLVTDYEVYATGTPTCIILQYFLQNKHVVRNYFWVHFQKGSLIINTNYFLKYITSVEITIRTFVSSNRNVIRCINFESLKYSIKV